MMYSAFVFAYMPAAGLALNSRKPMHMQALGLRAESEGSGFAWLSVVGILREKDHLRLTKLNYGGTLMGS